MAKINGSTKNNEGAVEVLKDLIIVQLGLAGIPQRAIREIVGCDLNRVTRIASLLRNRSAEAKGAKNKRELA